jgi:DNA-binding LacI/PurR family transcriptional regulator
MLASRHNLAREYGVALSTAQQAIANLVADGTLETYDRRGTFVAHTGATPDRDKGAKRDYPQTGALQTRQVSTATLGIVATARIDLTAAPDIGSLWARQAIRSLEQVFSAGGGTVRYFDRYPESHVPSSPEQDEAHAVPLPQAIETLRRDGADAIAVVALCDAKDMSDEVVSVIDVEHVPAVYISWHEIPPPLAQVFYDNRFAGYQAAQHLLRKGYRRLVFLAPFADGWLAERVAGARSAVRHAGHPPEMLRVYPGDRPKARYDKEVAGPFVSRMAPAFFDEILSGSSPDDPPGIISPNDQTAYALLEVAAREGKVAGHDFGIVGFDDDTRSCVAGLTTVRPPVEAMGEEAGRLLLRTMQGGREGLQVRLRSHLIPRASTLLRPAATPERRD